MTENRKLSVEETENLLPELKSFHEKGFEVKIYVSITDKQNLFRASRKRRKKKVAPLLKLANISSTLFHNFEKGISFIDVRIFKKLLKGLK